MSKLSDVLLGSCTHVRYTFPMRVKGAQRRPEAARLTGIYVACLDCGKEFAYSWDEMKVVPVSSRVKPSRAMRFLLQQKSQITAKVTEELNTAKASTPE